MTREVEELFEKFRQDGAIQRAASEHMSESAILDFKLVTSHEEALKVCPKVFGALANTFGGVVVWGVRCDERNGADGYKIATEPVPFNDIALFVRLLNGLTPFNGPYAKLRHEPVPLNEGEDRGFAVSYVSLGDPLPVMSKDCKYYTRSGSNSVPMNDALVRTMMLAQQIPSVSLKCSRMSSGKEFSSKQAYGWSYYLKLKNTGRVTIRNLAVAVHSDQIDVSVRSLLPSGTRKSSFDDLGSESMTSFLQFELYPGAGVEIVALEGQFRPREGLTMAEVKVRLFADNYSRDFLFLVDEDDLPDSDEDEVSLIDAF